MPLLLISGYPSSGKTHRSQQLIDFLEQKISISADAQVSKLKIHHVSDQSVGVSRDAYATARSEKDARATYSSAIKRHLSRNDVVVADGMNYIKGFRYQLYCEAKAVQTPNCVIHIGTPIETCRELNADALASGAGGYTSELFDNLVFRYEEPNGMTRWDSPLFTVAYNDASPPLDAIWEAMIGSDGKTKVVRPNAATVLKPATAQNHLYELDKATSDVVALIATWQKDHPDEGGGHVAVPGAEGPVELPEHVLALPQLQRLRRQFIQMNRTHDLGTDRIRTLFVDYLNDTFAN